MLGKKKYRCVLGPLTLCVREREPKQLDIRVVHRQTCSLFERALVIRMGTVLKLKHRKEVRFVQAKAFVPRLHYRGRFVAGGVLEIV